MKKLSTFAIALLALAGAASAQNVNQSFPRGSLLNQSTSSGVPAATQQQLANQLRSADQINFYKRGALLHQRAYQACTERENKKAEPNPYNCQNEMNIVNYYNGMAAAAQQSQQQSQQGQPQFDTTQSTQALRDLLKQPNIQATPLPPSQTGKKLPQMRSNL